MRTTFIVTRLLLFLATIALVAPTSLAQVSEKEKAQKELEQRQALERKTYGLVGEIASGGLALKLPENRLFVFASAADLLWKHDEARARNLFWDALNALNLMNAAASGATGLKGDKDNKNAKLSAKQKEQRLQNYFLVFGLRNELLRRVARRNPQLALDMLLTSRQLPVEPIHPNLTLPDDRELEQQIAAEAAAQDPARALQIARESLAKGLSFQLLHILYRLNDKDSELGTKFAGDIVEKLHGSNLNTNPYGARLAVDLLEFSRIPTEAPVLTASPRFRPLKLDAEQRRGLTEIIVNAALAGAADTNLLFSIEQVKPEIEQFVPERMALLQKKLAAFNQTLNKEQKFSQEYNSMFRDGTPEDLIKLASRSDVEEREWIQHQAIGLAVMKGRADALREFVSSEIDDQSRRRNLLDALDSEQLEYALNKGNAEELKKLLPQIRRKEERGRAMTQLAIFLEKQGQHDEALKMLDEAQTMIKGDLDSEKQTNALLSLMAAYALVEPDRAFGIIERTIDRANNDLKKILLLDKIISTGLVKKDEIKLPMQGMISIDFAVFRFGKGVSALAKVDFDRTKAAADRFERHELRLMARLLLAQALLQEDQKGANIE